MWSIRFAVLRVHEYHFHTYMLTITVQFIFFFCFFFCFILSWRFIAFYDKSNFTFQIIINIVRPIKKKIKCFGISYDNHIFFHYHNDLIKLFWTFSLISLCWYKGYKIFLVSVFNFLIVMNCFELLFGLIILLVIWNPCSLFFYLFITF